MNLLFQAREEVEEARKNVERSKLEHITAWRICRGLRSGPEYDHAASVKDETMRLEEVLDSKETKLIFFKLLFIIPRMFLSAQEYFSSSSLHETCMFYTLSN
jgi:hypothetical protein